MEKFKENETKNKKRAFRSSAASPSKVTLEKLVQSHNLAYIASAELQTARQQEVY